MIMDRGPGRPGMRRGGPETPANPAFVIAGTARMPLLGVMRSQRASGQPPARSRPAAGACAGVLLAGTLTACGGAAASPQSTARSYLADWARQDWAAMRTLVAAPPADFSAVNAAALADLGVRRASYSAGALRTRGARAAEPGRGGVR